MSIITQPAGVSLARAKMNVIDAARAIDLLAPMRRQPFVTVGVAAGVGAVLGMDGGKLAATAGLARAISSLVRLVVVAAEKYVIASANHAATEMNDRQETERRVRCPDGN